MSQKDSRERAYRKHEKVKRHLKKKKIRRSRDLLKAKAKYRKGESDRITD